MFKELKRKNKNNDIIFYAGIFGVVIITRIIVRMSCNYIIKKITPSTPEKIITTDVDDLEFKEEKP